MITFLGFSLPVVLVTIVLFKQYAAENPQYVGEQ
jgi:hypothetical protein